MLATFLEDVRQDGQIVPRRLADRLHVHLTQLSRMARVNRNALASKPQSPKVQQRLGEIARIIAKAAEMSGDEGRAIIWFRHQPIAGFGMTAEQLVELGRPELVMEELQRMEEGVYS